MLVMRLLPEMLRTCVRADNFDRCFPEDVDDCDVSGSAHQNEKIDAEESNLAMKTLETPIMTRGIIRGTNSEAVRSLIRNLTVYGEWCLRGEQQFPSPE